jgi:murein DD-endopeptidase MepM/ murein hydrolase activator NlpD
MKYRRAQNNTGRVMPRILLSLCFLVLLTPAGAEIYRYKNAQGRWVFSDEKPEGDGYDEVQVRGKEARKSQPTVRQRREGTEYVLSATNPWHLPVELQVKDPGLPGGSGRALVPADTTMDIHRGTWRMDSPETGWVMGDPSAEHDTEAIYRFPVASWKSFEISQGFNGRFSHQKRPNLHAIDVEMPMGAWLAAARGGTVARIKEDYHHSGTARFFADKANFVAVLHDDGTYAVYAHILPDTAVVEPGERVERGDRLARSGSSGFSTGPHLHFVIRRNTGLRPESVPFRIKNRDGRGVVPERGMRFMGQGKP